MLYLFVYQFYYSSTTSKPTTTHSLLVHKAKEKQQLLTSSHSLFYPVSPSSSLPHHRQVKRVECVISVVVWRSIIRSSRPICSSHLITLQSNTPQTSHNNMPKPPNSQNSIMFNRFKLIYFKDKLYSLRALAFG